MGTTRSRLAPALALAAGLLLVPAVEAQSLLGEWRLVEQTYGEGKANLIEPQAPPVRIEFFRDGALIRGRVSAGEEGAESMAWPRLSADPSRVVHVEEQRVPVEGDRVRARYRVEPAPGDDLTLFVTEEYAVVEEGRALVGTVRVEFFRDGEERGSYLLHRRFRRES